MSGGADRGGSGSRTFGAGEKQAEAFAAERFRALLEFLNRLEAEDSEAPLYVATNAILMEIANLEDKSLNEVIEEVRRA